jgi:hypothetical protein
MGGLNDEELFFCRLFLPRVSVWVVFECYEGTSALARHRREMMEPTELLELLLDFNNLRSCSQLEISVVISIVVGFDHRDFVARSIDGERCVGVAGGNAAFHSWCSFLDVAALYSPSTASSRWLAAASQMGHREERVEVGFRDSGSFVALRGAQDRTPP